MGWFSFNLILGNFKAILPINKYVAPNFTEGTTYVLNKPLPSKFSKKWTEFLTIVSESNLKIALYEKGCYTTPYPIEGSTAIAGCTVLHSYNASMIYQTRPTSRGQHMRESKSKFGGSPGDNVKIYRPGNFHIGGYPPNFLRAEAI